MESQLLILVTDLNYIEHVKYNIKNIRNVYGEIEICVLCDKSDYEEIKKLLDYKNVFIRKIQTDLEQEERKYLNKFHIFDPFFKRWQKILYIDCDTLIFSSLNDIFKILSDEKNFIVDFENSEIKDFFYNLSVENLDINQIEIIKNKGFNTGIILFNSSIIENNTISNLYHLSEKLSKYNRHGHGEMGDQPIINIYFYQIASQVVENMFCYWVNIDERTIISHFCHWFAPWVNNNFSPKLNDTYKNYYTKTKNEL